MNQIKKPSSRMAFFKPDFMKSLEANLKEVLTDCVHCDTNTVRIFT